MKSMAVMRKSMRTPESMGQMVPSPEECSMQDLLRENAELRRMVAELESLRNLAYRDPLTSLWNRRYFEERMDQELSHARRDPSRRFSVMVVDLNDLKRVNDEQGHAAGDLALKRVAQFLKSKLRDHDICCRTGGDEFAIILLDAGPAECEQLMERLRRQLEVANARLPQAEMPVALSFGTASFPDDCSTSHDLYLQADAAMYQDKRQQKRRTAEMAAATRSVA